MKITKVHFHDTHPDTAPGEPGVTRLVETDQKDGYWLVVDRFNRAGRLPRSAYRLEKPCGKRLLALRNSANDGWADPAFRVVDWLEKECREGGQAVRIGSLDANGHLRALMGTDPAALAPPMSVKALESLWWLRLPSRKREGESVWRPVQLIFYPAGGLGGREPAAFCVKVFTEEGGTTSFNLNERQVAKETWGGPVAGPQID